MIDAMARGGSRASRRSTLATLVVACAAIVAACSSGPAATTPPGPVGSPTPAATAQPATPAPTVAVTAIPTNAAGVRTCPSSSQGPEIPCQLDAGEWATAFQTPALTYIVPSTGWSSLDREASPGNFHLFPPGSSMAGFNTGSGDVITVIASGVPPGTCTGAPSTEFANTFDGLVKFLTTNTHVTVGGLEDTTVGGLDGKVLNIAFAKSDGCVDGTYVDLYVGVGRSHGQFGIPPATASMRLFLLHVPGNDKALVVEIDDGKGGGSDYGDGDGWYQVAQGVVDSFVFTP
jgi:hypothetical protein